MTRAVFLRVIMDFVACATPSAVVVFVRSLHAHFWHYVLIMSRSFGRFDTRGADISSTTSLQTCQYYSKESLEEKLYACRIGTVALVTNWTLTNNSGVGVSRETVSFQQRSSARIPAPHVKWACDCIGEVEYTYSVLSGPMLP